MSHPQPPQRQPTPSETERYLQTVHNVALFALITCPILALTPPRKLDFYTMGLVGVTGFSANYLIREQSGRSIWQHATRQQPFQQRVQDSNALLTEVKNERESWKAHRQREIREDVEEGKGFADMIYEQIWEVWNQGKTKEEDED